MLYYEQTGDHGDPMLLVHGSWGDHNNWVRVAPGLSKDFRVVTYDRRGHTNSERPSTQGSAEEDAADADALMAHLGLLPAHFVANSFGGVVTLKLAVRKRSDFLSLVVHEPPLFDVLEGEASAPMAAKAQERVASVVKLLEAGNRAEGARRFVETVASGSGEWDKFPPALKETFISNADTFADEIRDPGRAALDLQALSKFAAPALLSYGGRSPPFFKSIVEKLAKAIPGSMLDVYPADGHAPHISNPVEFVSRTTKFALSVRR
jgi:pimeloyl-ACP methyl ester carboxylesterase